MNAPLAASLRGLIESHDAQLFTTPHLSRVRHAAAALLALLEPAATAPEDACPGCGCVPGDGITESCNDAEGCGFWKAEHARSLS